MLKNKNYPRTQMGSGGSDKPDLKGEFNSRTHLRGTLAAARSKSLDSANSQNSLIFLMNSFKFCYFYIWDVKTAFLATLHP